MNRIFLAVAVTAIVFPAYSQTTATKQQTNTSPSAATQQFVGKTANSDMFEIQSSKMALEKSQNGEIRDFAKRIIDDHTKSGNELKSMAQNVQGLEIPSRMDADHQKKIEQLSAAGAQFDLQYRNQQIEGHNTAVQLFTNYSQSGDNDELRSFAEKTLPRLQEHLKMAQDLPIGPAAPSVAQATKTQQQGGPQSGTQQQMRQTMAAPGPNHVLGSELRGGTVYGTNNENIGEIRDILLNRDGRVVAVIVGVGGFLGLGEKDVAVPFDAIEMPTQRKGTKGAARRESQPKGSQNGGSMQRDRVVLRGMTRQDLEAAPDFDSDNMNQNRNQNQTR